MIFHHQVSTSNTVVLVSLLLADLIRRSTYESYRATHPAETILTASFILKSCILL